AVLLLLDLPHAAGPGTPPAAGNRRVEHSVPRLHGGAVHLRACLRPQPSLVGLRRDRPAARTGGLLPGPAAAEKGADRRRRRPAPCGRGRARIGARRAVPEVYICSRGSGTIAVCKSYDIHVNVDPAHEVSDLAVDKQSPTEEAIARTPPAFQRVR